MTSAEAAFDAVTRAAYAAFLHSPPAITYRLTVHEANAIHGPLYLQYDELYDSRTAMTRRHDAGSGTDEIERPFVAAPNLDAVGTFEAEVTAYAGRLVFMSYEPLPLNVAAPTPPPHADAWTFANGSYQVAFDPKDPTQSTILTRATKTYLDAHHGWLVSRVHFDRTTNLPVDVEMTDGAKNTLRFTYQSVEGVQLLRRVVLSADAPVYFGGTLHGYSGLEAQADYSDYAFPSPPQTALRLDPATERAQVAYAKVWQAAHAAFVRSPPSIAYKVHVEENDQTYGMRGFDLDQRYDTRTGVARTFDEATRDTQNESPFLAAPNLDPLYAFQAVEAMSKARFTFSAVQMVQAASGDQFAPDDADAVRPDASDPAGTTLEFVPLDPSVAAVSGWHLDRIRYDPATFLPTHAVLRAPGDAELTLDYGPVNGAWLLTRGTYDGNVQVKFGNVPTGATHVHVVAQFADYAF